MTLLNERVALPALHARPSILMDNFNRLLNRLLCHNLSNVPNISFWRIKNVTFLKKLIERLFHGSSVSVGQKTLHRILFLVLSYYIMLIISGKKSIKKN